MAAQVESFGLDRDDIQGGKFKKFKGKENHTDRVGIVFLKESEMFKGVRTHYKDKYFLCKSTKEKKEICCTHGYERNRPSYRMGCVLVVYDTVEDKNKKLSLKGYELLPWIIGEKMYGTLSEEHKEHPLTNCDMRLKCTNAEYQNFEVHTTKESIWQSNPKLKEKILEQAGPLIEDLSRSLASDLTVTEIRDLLGVDEAGSEDAATNIDLGAVADVAME